jgi:four helix bundle protein
MTVFELSKKLPIEERYSMTDQMRRSSRSAATNITEGWRKRRYEAAFISKLSDSETEAAETQTWLEFGVRCGYFTRDEGKGVYKGYNILLGKIVTMINNPKPWLV